MLASITKIKTSETIRLQTNDLMQVLLFVQIIIANCVKYSVCFHLFFCVCVCVFPPLLKESIKCKMNVLRLPKINSIVRATNAFKLIEMERFRSGLERNSNQKRTLKSVAFAIPGSGNTLTT